MTEQEDRQLIRELVENWVLWRDSRMWKKFRTLWHDDGVMMATWSQGTADEFIARSQTAFDNGVRILHELGGTTVELCADRAIAQTRMTIHQRAAVHGVVCDVACIGRFYDFLEKRRGRWGLVLRQPIYEKDRLDPLDPGASLTLDPERLKRYPEGYRHLAYLQEQAGFTPKAEMPGLVGPELERLYSRGERWLKGEPL